MCLWRLLGLFFCFVIYNLCMLSRSLWSCSLLLLLCGWSTHLQTIWCNRLSGLGYRLLNSRLVNNTFRLDVIVSSSCLWGSKRCISVLLHRCWSLNYCRSRLAAPFFLLFLFFIIFSILFFLRVDIQSAEVVHKIGHILLCCQEVRRKIEWLLFVCRGLIIIYLHRILL